MLILKAKSMSVDSDRTRGNGLKLRQGRFNLYIRKKFFSQRVVEHWHRVPRAAVETPSMKIFKTHLYTNLRDLL